MLAGRRSSSGTRDENLVSALSLRCRNQSRSPTPEGWFTEGAGDWLEASSTPAFARDMPHSLQANNKTIVKVGGGGTPQQILNMDVANEYSDFEDPRVG